MDTTFYQGLIIRELTIKIKNKWLETATQGCENDLQFLQDGRRRLHKIILKSVICFDW